MRWQSKVYGRPLTWLSWCEAVLLIGLLMVPLLLTLKSSFESLDPSVPGAYGRWIGVENYVQLIAEPLFFRSLWASLRFIGIVLLECVLALTFGIGLRLLWPSRLPGALMATMMLPILISPTIVGLMGRFYLNDQIGYGSRILKALGWLGRDDAVLATASGAWWTLAILDAWQWGPFTIFLFWLSLKVVPRRQIEAAQVDGVPWWSAVRLIHLPHVWPAVATVAIVRVFWAIRSFDVPVILTGGGPGTSTMMVTQFASRLTFSEQRHGVGAAHLILIELFVLVMVTVAVWFFRGRVSLLRKRNEVT